jgi:hypothetical protein
MKTMNWNNKLKLNPSITSKVLIEKKKKSLAETMEPSSKKAVIAAGVYGVCWQLGCCGFWCMTSCGCYCWFWCFSSFSCCMGGSSSTTTLLLFVVMGLGLIFAYVIENLSSHFENCSFTPKIYSNNPDSSYLMLVASGS